MKTVNPPTNTVCGGYTQTQFAGGIKIFNLLENYLKILACSQVSDRCPLGYLFSHIGTEPLLPEYYQYFRGVKCLAQGHKTAEVGFEPSTSGSGVRRSTTEPPCSLNRILKYKKHKNYIINSLTVQ